jgi:hypothetical protein
MVIEMICSLGLGVITLCRRATTIKAGLTLSSEFQIKRSTIVVTVCIDETEHGGVEDFSCAFMETYRLGPRYLQAAE